MTLPDDVIPEPVKLRKGPYKPANPRKQIKLHPDVMELLEDYKDTIHRYASPSSLRKEGAKPYRRPMSWNEFFMIIVHDWRGGRAKCHCGHFHDCPHCELIRNSGIVKGKRGEYYRD